MSNPRASGLGNPTSKILPGSEKQQIYRQDQGNDATVDNTGNGDMDLSTSLAYDIRRNQHLATNITPQ